MKEVEEEKKSGSFLIPEFEEDSPSLKLA